MAGSLKLLTALGNPMLVWEMVDFFNGGDRFTYNREAAGIRSDFAGRALGEIHLFCTGGVMGAGKTLADELAGEYPDIRVELVPLACDDICCSSDDTAMREIVYRTVKDLSDPDLIIASGGRKQVTQRLIEAGLLYGCRGYLTITAPRDKEDRRHSKHFNITLTTARQFSEERRQRIIKDELGDNFRSLYLLPTEIIARLRRDRIGRERQNGKAEIEWLRRLPKADLHCHLGGSYDAALLKKMAAALLEELNIDAERQQNIIRHIEETAQCPISGLNAAALRRNSDKGHVLQNLEEFLKDLPEAKHIAVAALVRHLSAAQIEEISRDGISDQEKWPHDLDWYMACGDLGGSALLQTENTLRLALRWLMEQAAAENVCFMEVRFSPDNYTRGGLSIRRVIDTLLNEAAAFTGKNPGFHIHFLIMATRHKNRAAMTAHVAAAVSFGRPGGGSGPRITGFDLAGQEEDNDPVKFKDVFLPLHHHFMNITIHAGEMAEDDKIWQAIYDLHARRIGHGLKLVNNKKMMDYIRDYGIAIEMCPSSNMQTNGFRRFDRAEQGPLYPLHAYMEHGITVTVNTDNRGISATTLSDEYLAAARLTEDGLSKWQILKLIKNSFKAVFLPRDEKDRLLKEIDDRIFAIILDDYYPERT